MSSYWAGYHGAGIVLKAAEFMEFLKGYEAHRLPGCPVEELEEKIVGDDPLSEYPFIRSCVRQPYYSTDYFYITLISPDDCDGMWFSPFKRPDGRWNVPDPVSHETCLEERGRDETFCVIFLDEPLDGPWRWAENKYPTYEAALKECQDKLACYLPEGFDWDAHFGRFSYAAYA